MEKEEEVEAVSRGLAVVVVEELVMDKEMVKMTLSLDMKPWH
jgi:hypothetical protein